MDYDPAGPALLDHDVTIEEVAEYFTNYILNDNLGIINNAHTVFADKEPTKAQSEQCIELAKLSSIAVDFPKTGIPAKIPHHLRVQQYPDFMEKPNRLTYESQSVIGRLYREVKAKSAGVSDAKHFTREVAERCYDPDLEVDGYLAYVNDAFHYKSEYDSKLANLMRYYGVKTEAEMISGCIMKMSKSFDRRKDLETVILAMKSLKKEAKGWFKEKGDDELDSNIENAWAKASAWYHVTYHPNFWGCYNDATDQEHFISFPWCVYDKLVQIKKEKISKVSSNLPLSEAQVNHGDGLHSHKNDKLVQIEREIINEGSSNLPSSEAQVNDDDGLHSHKNDKLVQISEEKINEGSSNLPLSEAQVNYGDGLSSDQKASRWSNCSLM